MSFSRRRVLNTSIGAHGHSRRIVLRIKILHRLTLITRRLAVRKRRLVTHRAFITVDGLIQVNCHVLVDRLLSFGEGARIASAQSHRLPFGLNLNGRKWLALRLLRKLRSATGLV